MHFAALSHISFELMKPKRLFDVKRTTSVNAEWGYISMATLHFSCAIMLLLMPEVGSQKVKAGGKNTFATSGESLRMMSVNDIM